MGKIKNQFNMDRLNAVSGGAMPSAKQALSEKKQLDQKNAYEILNIPVDQLQPMSYNREVYEVDDLDFLGATISQYGLAQPLVVQRQPGTDKYNIVAGERRYQSYLKSKADGKAAGLYPNGLPCHVYPENMSPVDIKIMLLITNATSRARTAETQRKELQELVSLFNEAEASGTTIGFSLKELAKNHLKIAERQYQRYMSALRVIPELKQFTDASDVILAAAIGSKPEDVQREIYAYMQEQHCSIEDAHEAVNEEYGAYRQQLQALRKQVRTLQHEKQQWLNQSRAQDATTPGKAEEAKLNLARSTEKLEKTRKELDKLQANAGRIVRSGMQKKLHKKEPSHTITQPTSAAETQSCLSVKNAIRQMNAGLNSVGLQMKACDEESVEQLKLIRDRLDKIINVIEPQNQSIF